VSFIEFSFGNKAERTFQYLEVLLQHLFAFTEIEELKDCSAVGFLELLAVASIEGFRLFRRSQSIVRNEKAVIAFEEVCKYQYFISGRTGLASLECCQAITRYA